MTDEELAKLHNIYRLDEDEVGQDLVAEVRRLKRLIKQVESAARSGAACPWCDSWIAERHNVDCPAFTESGDVR